MMTLNEELRYDTPQGPVLVLLQEDSDRLDGIALRSVPGRGEPGEELVHAILEKAAERAQYSGIRCKTLNCWRHIKREDGSVESVQVIDALELPDKYHAVGFLEDAIARVAGSAAVVA